MHSKYRLIILISILFFGFTQCQNDEVLENKIENEDVVADANTPQHVAKGKMRVKFSEQVVASLEKSQSSTLTRSGNVDIDNYLEEIGVRNMKRVFPHAGKYEERSRKEGLHLWYDIDFDEQISVTRATSTIKNIKGVDIVEEIIDIELPPLKRAVAFPTTKNLRSDDLPTTDPLLADQWHYNNTGSIRNSDAGADINLFEAWEIEVGKPNVIVSIVDAGIDYTHEDLKESMWINELELNGIEGVDDDGNGEIDDIYGYNFVKDTGEIEAGDHGTHVAGTVGARNNNGIGVAGVAGGDGSPESGVRLMSCQIFGPKGENGNSAAAVKYGADNGAVISQNSWGYNYPGPSSIPASMKAAIDYFIKYAGCDENGEQRDDSPMKGGVVIFAAGNDDLDFYSYPAAYEPVVAVSAMSPSWKKAWYTNRGDWVDIMAPGGDEYYQYPKGMVLSSVPGNKYGYMQGTSMACPHVSGVAALVVSKFGGKGFTNTELKQRISNSLKFQNIDENNPGYEGRLGIGYIDAAMALSENLNKKPNSVANVTVTTDFTELDLSWNAVKDEDDKTAILYTIYFSEDNLTQNNYTQAKSLTVNASGKKAGDKLTKTIAGLNLNTTYYMCIIAQDRWGLKSAPTFFTGKTKENFAPELKREGDESIRIAGKETANVSIIVKEPENQEWTYKVTGDQTGVTVTREKDIIKLSFKAIAQPGSYSVTIEVKDIFGATSSITVPFEIYKNTPPEQIKSFEKTFVPVNKSDYSIKLSDYFRDVDNQKITYTARSFDPSIAGVTLKDDVLTINPARVGLVSIEVSATDTHDAKAKANFQFHIVNDGLVYIVYPIPATTELNVRLSDELTTAELSVFTTTGKKVISQTVNANSPEQRLVKLDVSKISGGSYVLQVSSSGKTFTQPFVKY